MEKVVIFRCIVVVAVDVAHGPNVELFQHRWLEI